MNTAATIRATDLHRIARLYPEELVQSQLADASRIEFLLSLIPECTALCDIGGGTSMFAAACKAKVRRVVLIDDFRDPDHIRFGDAAFRAHVAHGVELISRDVVASGIGDFTNSFDVITCFDSIEHWHNSPKRTLHQAMHAMVRGGTMIIGVPNALNVRKRISWLLGTGQWSSMESWYEQDVFRSHVREPSVSDLEYIAKDIGLTDVFICGRNWSGLISPHKYRRAAARIFDRALRLRPSLCSDLYLIGRKG